MRARGAHLAINVGVEETEDVLELHVGLGDDERHCGIKAASQPHGPGMSLARVCSLLGGLRMRRRGPHARRLRPRAKIERVRRFARAPPFRAFSLTTFRTRTFPSGCVSLLCKHPVDLPSPFLITPLPRLVTATLRVELG